MKNKIHTLKVFVIALILVLSSILVSAGDFNIYNASDNTQTYFAINGTTGNIGIGMSNPTTLLQILNDRWFSAKNYLGTGIVNMFKVSQNDSIEVGATLNIGSFKFNEDSGLVTFVDMPVSSTPAAGTSESYVFKVDGDNIMTIYSEADGSGGVQNKRVGIGTITPQNTLNVIGAGNFTGNLYGGTVYSGGSEVLTSFTETDPYWTGNQSSYFTKSDILGFSYYNLTSFDIADYYLKSNPFAFINTTTASNLNYLILSKWANITDAPTNLSFFTDDLGDRGYTHLTNFTDDILWTTGFNATGDTRWLTSYTETDPYWTGNQSSYSTTAEILAFGYYNASDFIITDYFTKTDILGFGYYNLTDFDIADYFTSSEVLAFNYYNSSDFDIADYFTSAQILGFNYYNSSDFVISDYYTKTQIDNFNFYNLTDFDIDDYYTKTQVYNKTEVDGFSLSKWIDDLGDRGYTHLTNFTDDILWTSGFNATGDSRWLGVGDESDPLWTGNFSNVAFINKANAFGAFNQSFDTNVLFVDATNDRVGIGTAGPGQKLEVAGNIKTTETAATSDTDKFVVFDSGVVKFRTGDELLKDTLVISPRKNQSNPPSEYPFGMYVMDSESDVPYNWTYDAGIVWGIKPAHSNYRHLQFISQAQGTALKMRMKNGTNDSWLAWQNIPIGSSFVDYSGSNTNYIAKFSDSNTITKSVLYEDSGKVGIGITSPQQKLHVAGNAVINGTLNMDSNKIISLGNGTSAQDAVTLSQLQSVNVSAVAEETDPLWTGNFSSKTGTGNVVYSTSPTLVTPNIGAATAGGTLNMNNNAITNINWAGSDDGSGSGLDADLLDGSEKTAFQMDVSDSCSGENVIQTIAQDGTTTCYNTYSAADDLIGTIGEWQDQCTNCVTDGDVVDTITVKSIRATDDRDYKPNTTASWWMLRTYFTSLGGMTGASDSNYQDLVILNTYADGSGGDINALTFDKSEKLIKHWLADQTAGTWGTPKTIAYIDSNMTGIWSGTPVADAYVSDTITASNYVRKSTWTDIDDYPSGCSAGQAVRVIGDTLTCIDVENATILEGYPASFFMPLNTSVVGNFSFNGGWTEGGLSIIEGDIYAQQLFVYNISHINASHLNINGSLLPWEGFDNQFDIGASDKRWRDLWISRDASIGGDLSLTGTMTSGTVPWARLSDHPTIEAGTGLEGGGDLSTNRTLSLTDTGVSAGGYGSTTINYPRFTVDAKGRITSASNQTIRTATTSVSGITTLTASVSSTGNTTASTPWGVKVAYDTATAKASPGTCSVGQVVQNTTTGGVQCVDVDKANAVNGTGTQNTIAKWTGTGTLGDSGINDLSDALAITIDSSERVGIGTTTPQNKLNVVGDLNVTSTSTFMDTVTIDTGKWLRFYDNDGTYPTAQGGFQWDLNNDDARIYAHQPASDQIDFVFKIADNVGTTDRFIYWIDSHTGASDDAYPLYMDGTKVVMNYPNFYSSGDSQNIDFYLMGNGSTALSQAYFFGDAVSERIGIGTTSPQQKLHVAGNAVINGTLNMDSNKIISLGNGTSAQDAITLSQLQAVNESAVAEETDPYWTGNQSLVYLKSNPFSFVNTSTASNLNYLILSKWANITDAPTTLSFFTDDLGNRGYTHLTNFTDDILWTTGFNATGDARWLTSYTETDPYWTGNFSNVAFINKANAFGAFNQSFDTNVLFVDATNDKVGINTTTPQNTLNVIGDANITGTLHVLGTVNATMFYGDGLKDYTKYTDGNVITLVYDI